MKNAIWMVVLSMILLSGPRLFATTEGLQPAPEAPEMDEIRGIDQTALTQSDSDPDDWGEGEVILGGDPEANERAKEIAKVLAEQEPEEITPEEPGMQLTEEEKRLHRRQFRQARELFKKLLEENLQEEGWRLEVDPNGNPYLEGPEGERIDPETDPDDWGEGEKIL